MVHFDCEGPNDRIVWAADVVATPSSSHDSIPQLDPDYWDRVRSVPRTKLKRLRLGRRVGPKPELDGPNAPDPELVVSAQSTIKMASYLGTGGICTAYRGTWFGVPIVAKYVHRMDDVRPLADEVHAYLCLDHLRGPVIPEFFGLYRTDSFALLILEDVGDMINNPFGPEPRTRPNDYDLDDLDEWTCLDDQERCAFSFHEIKHFLTCMRNNQSRLVMRHIPCAHGWRRARGHLSQKCRQRTQRNSPHRLLTCSASYMRNPQMRRTTIFEGRSWIRYVKHVSLSYLPPTMY
jgi:hypothetical protein